MPPTVPYAKGKVANTHSRNALVYLFHSSAGMYHGFCSIPGSAEVHRKALIPVPAQKFAWRFANQDRH